MTSAIKIGLSGLLSSAAQLQASASNITNAGTTTNSNGFKDSLQNLSRNNAYSPTSIKNTPLPGGGVQATSIQTSPSHLAVYSPEAFGVDNQEIVVTPNVSITEEVANMKIAARTYEANAHVISVAQEMQDTVLKKIK